MPTAPNNPACRRGGLTCRWPGRIARTTGYAVPIAAAHTGIAQSSPPSPSTFRYSLWARAVRFLVSDQFGIAAHRSEPGPVPVSGASANIRRVGGQNSSRPMRPLRPRVVNRRRAGSTPADATNAAAVIAVTPTPAAIASHLLAGRERSPRRLSAARMPAVSDPVMDGDTTAGHCGLPFAVVRRAASSVTPMATTVKMIVLL